MRLQINLASEPFRRDRPLIVGSAVVGVLLLALLVMLVSLSIGERDRAAESRDTIRRMQNQLQVISREQAQLESVFRKPENSEVLERSVFLNQLLARKGVSWTKILLDLEQITPANVRLIQVRPQINGQNELLLDMVVASQSTEPVLSFLMQLEGSPVFGATTIHNSVPPSMNEPLYRYRVSVNYAQKL